MEAIIIHAPQTGFRFLLLLTIGFQILRLLGILFIFLYPNALGVHSLNDMNQLHDGFWYYFIAKNGYYLQGILQEKLANYAPLYPWLLWTLKWILPLEVAPLILNTALTLFIPWLALKFTEKIVVPRGKDSNELDLKRRRQIITIGIVLNPILLSYSIFNLTEPLFYLLLLVVLNCSVHKGPKYAAGEMIFLVFLGISRFVAVLICIYYSYLIICKGLLQKQYKTLYRPLACIFIAAINFLLWDIIIPTSIFGISAAAAMDKYWGVAIRFDPASVFFTSKLIIIGLGALGGFYVLRMLVLRENWTILGFREKYLHRLKITGSFDDLEEPYDYIIVEALLLYGFSTIIFHGMMDPLLCFYRYVGSVLPLFAFINIKNKVTGQIPRIILAFITFTIGYNIPGVLMTVVGPEIWFYFFLILLATIFFPLYYKETTKVSTKPSNMRKIAFLLGAGSVFLMFINIYMP